MQGKGMRGESAKQVAIDVLRKARGPLRASEVAKRVIESGRCAGLKGKTPEATVSAMLAVGSKPGGPFTRVDKGMYTLSEQVANPKPAAKSQKRGAVSGRSGRRRRSRPAKPGSKGTRRAPRAGFEAGLPS